MSATPLPAIAPFLRLLASLATPGTVLPALVQGPLAAFGTVAGSLVRLDHDALVTLASVGYPTDELARYRAIPMDVDVPFVRAVLGRRVVGTPVRSLLDEYPLLRVDERMWASVLAQVPDGVLVSVPIALDDVVAGAYGFLAADPAAAAAEADLLGLSAALGLWMTHPRRPTSPAPTRAAGSGLALTPRQARILRGVERGLGNASIALELGCSRDTVKADLQRAMRVLGVSTRQDAVERASGLGLL